MSWFLEDFMRKNQAMTLILGAMLAGVANSATTTASFSVTETLLATCSATATTLAFTAYTPGVSAVTNNSTISVKCTKNTPYTISLNKGTTVGGTVAQRLMAFGANTLQYNVYTTAAANVIFGDGSGGSQTESGIGAGVATANTVTVFGKVPDNATNQAGVPGNYTDTITVTVTY
jgi:spore coat protein U-like protein